MQETEIEVNSFEETNELLEKLGFSYRSYQEKRREKYILNEHEIDIDTWPKLLPYIEIEGKDKNDIEKILSILGYSFKDTISCTVDEIYKKIGLDVNNMKELEKELMKTDLQEDQKKAIQEDIDETKKVINQMIGVRNSFKDNFIAKKLWYGLLYKLFGGDPRKFLIGKNDDMDQVYDDAVARAGKK